MALPLLFLLGCGGPSEHAAADLPVDSLTESSEPPVEVPTDVPPVIVECASVLRMDETFDLLPNGGATQIHADAVFDGEGVWIAYNAAEERSGLFDVFAVRMRCDGQAVVGPFRVNTTTRGNDVDPAIAFGEGRVLIAWYSDDGSGGDSNLQTYYRVFAADGTPVMDADARLVTTRAGALITLNTWQPAIAALPTGGFILAGGRSVPEAMRPQIFVQIITADGVLDGEAADGHFQVMASDQTPSVSVDAGGLLHLAWDRTADGGEPQVVHRSVNSGASVPELAGEGYITSTAPSLATGPTSLFLALGATVTSQADIHVVDLQRPLAERVPLVVGTPARNEHGPRLVVRDNGGVVAFYRNIGGLQNRIHVQSFRVESGAFTPGDDIEVMDELAYPYPLAFTGVSDVAFFLAWTVGSGSNLHLRGRFLTVP